VKNLHTMTTAQLCDWHAERAGWFAPKTNPDAPANVEWTKRDRLGRLLYGGWSRGQATHPFPPTLDDAASAMPEGVRACLVETGCASGIWLEWRAVKKEKWGYRVLAKCPDTNDETRDRYLLAALAAKQEAGE
jgi:hypothetical protein